MNDVVVMIFFLPRSYYRESMKKAKGVIGIYGDFAILHIDKYVISIIYTEYSITVDLYERYKSGFYRRARFGWDGLYKSFSWASKKYDTS